MLYISLEEARKSIPVPQPRKETDGIDMKITPKSLPTGPEAVQAMKDRYTLRYGPSEPAY